jgi:hypothetical protein
MLEKVEELRRQHGLPALYQDTTNPEEEYLRFRLDERRRARNEFGQRRTQPWRKWFRIAWRRKVIPWEELGLLDQFI